MVFSSLSFLCFFLPGTLIAYYAWSNNAWRNLILLAASLFFYTWGEPIYIFLMIGSILVNWKIGLLFNHKQNNRTILTVGIFLNIIAIGFFKYAGFLVLNINRIIGTNWHVPDISLPIGISFYTFQAISYIVDASWGKIIPQGNPLFFGTYLSLFPQLIAGPIVRYKTIEKDLIKRKETLDNFTAGLRRFVVGLGKKILIANNMGIIADSVINSNPSVGMIVSWYAFAAYAFQIYFDFSGYSDMAIGLGRMFGFNFPENFNYPYTSKSISEFWRRWHISLSSFFRDYLYIPLGGNRVSKSRWTFNLLVVWGLTGLWHGASWNFIAWGLYYGVLLIGEHLLWGKWMETLPSIIRHGYTIFLFLIGWVIFRIEDFGQMSSWLATLFGKNGIGDISTLSALNILHYFPWFFVAIVGSTRIGSVWMKQDSELPFIGWVKEACIIFLFFLSVLSIARGGFNPFIYFRF